VQVVTVAPQTLQKIEAEFENFSGLVGSTYNIFAVLSWEDFGVRNTASTAGFINIEKESETPIFAGALIGVAIAMAFALYFFVFRK
jgi:hypothetical protein